MTVFIYYPWEGVLGHLRPILNYFMRFSATVKLSADPNDLCCKRVYDWFFIWNGAGIDLTQLNHRNVRFLELSAVHQQEALYIDPVGVNAESSLLRDPLEWVTDQMIEKVHSARQLLCEGRTIDESRGILCPLQVENDTNMKWHSPFKTNQEFIDAVSEGDARKLTFRRHPLDPNIEADYKLPPGCEWDEGNLFDNIGRSSKVIGMNSTVLLQAALMGKPVEAYGEGYAKAHAHQLDKILAALLDREIPLDADNISRWLSEDPTEDAPRDPRSTSC